MAWVDEARLQAVARSQPLHFSATLQVCSDLAGDGGPDTATVRQRIDAVFAFVRPLAMQAEVRLCGGDPGARGDLVELVAHIGHVHGGDAVVQTRWSVWSQNLVDDLWAARLRSVQLVVDDAAILGDGPEGAQRTARLFAQVQRLRSRGFDVRLDITLHARNWEATLQLLEVLDPLGATFWLREAFPATTTASTQTLPRMARREVAQWVVRWQGQSRVHIEDPIHCSVDPKFAAQQSGCVAGRSHLSVDLQGRVTPCQPLALDVGDVGDLQAAWRHPAMERLRHRDLTGDCGRCSLRWHCGGCRVHAAAHGDTFGEDPRCFAGESGQLMAPWAGEVLLRAERLAHRVAQWAHGDGPAGK